MTLAIERPTTATPEPGEHPDWCDGRQADGGWHMSRVAEFNATTHIGGEPVVVLTAAQQGPRGTGVILNISGDTDTEITLPPDHALALAAAIVGNALLAGASPGVVAQFLNQPGVM